MNKDKIFLLHNLQLLLIHQLNLPFLPHLLLISLKILKIVKLDKNYNARYCQCLRIKLKIKYIMKMKKICGFVKLLIVWDNLRLFMPLKFMKENILSFSSKFMIGYWLYKSKLNVTFNMSSIWSKEQWLI